MGPNQRVLPSSEGLTSAVEGKAPMIVNLRFKDLDHESRTGQGKFRNLFLKEPVSVVFTAVTVVEWSIVHSENPSRLLVFCREIFCIQIATAGKVNASRPTA